MNPPFTGNKCYASLVKEFPRSCKVRVNSNPADRHGRRGGDSRPEQPVFKFPKRPRVKRIVVVLTEKLGFQMRLRLGDEHKVEFQGDFHGIPP